MLETLARLLVVAWPPGVLSSSPWRDVIRALQANVAVAIPAPCGRR